MLIHYDIPVDISKVIDEFAFKTRKASKIHKIFGGTPQTPYDNPGYATVYC